MIGLIKKMINSDHREPLNNLMYIQDLVTSGQSGYVANSEDKIQSLITSPNVLLNATAKTEFFKGLGKYTKPNLDFIKHVTGINVNSHTELASNGAMMQAISNNRILIEAVVNSQVAMQEIVNSQVAMQIVLNNNSFFQMIADSTTGANAIANSDTSLRLIMSNSSIVSKALRNRVLLREFSSSSKALRLIVDSQTARTTLMDNNSIFQENKRTMYDTIRRDSSRWTIQHFHDDSVSNVANRVTKENIFVFFCAGAYGSGGADRRVSVYHRNNKEAIPHTNDVEHLNTKAHESNPLPVVSGVSFGGCRFHEQGDGYVTVDAFTPR